MVTLNKEKSSIINEIENLELSNNRAVNIKKNSLYIYIYVYVYKL